MNGQYNWMKVVDVMTPSPYTVTPSESIGRAVELMSAHGIRQLPVVAGKILVGVISDRDIRSTITDPTRFDTNGSDNGFDILVGDAMTRDPVTLSPDDSLEQAVEAFIEDKFGGFPVVSSNAELLGIVTYIDLLRCFLNRMKE
ncbi:MAG: CBS domain-containing protein [Chloroflexota bacterium]